MSTEDREAMRVRLNREAMHPSLDAGLSQASVDAIFNGTGTLSMTGAPARVDGDYVSIELVTGEMFVMKVTFAEVLPGREWAKKYLKK